MTWAGLFCAQLLEFLWTGGPVPQPSEVADWIEAHPQRPPDWARLCDRLRHWGEGRAFAPIPDDDALANGIGASDRRWWEPGATAKVMLGFSLLRPTRHVQEADLEPPALNLTPREAEVLWNTKPGDVVMRDEQDEPPPCEYPTEEVPG